MITTLNLHPISYPTANNHNSNHHHHQLSINTVTLLPYNLRLPKPHTLCLPSISNSHDTSSFEPSPTTFTSSIASPPPSVTQWNLDNRHVTLLNYIACATAISATWLFLSAIPTLLAFKRAAESLEKLLDVTREELPDTMAAVRLSGMEISDLTMELSDLGQEITQGVKSSTRAVRVAEERLRRLTNMTPSASMQVVVQMKPELAGLTVARTAREICENIVKSRAFMQMFFSLTHFLKVVYKFLKSRSKSKA